MKAIDWTPIQKKYPGRWVALANDEITVLGVGKTVQAAIDAARKRAPHRKPILTWMPEKILPYVGAL